MNKTVELKPCPFCGGKAILNVSHSVECINACICPVIPRTWTYDTDEEAIEAWNHRIPTIEAIPKDHYEARLKADMVAMLNEIKADITYHSSRYNLAKEQGGVGQVVWSENLYKEADIMSVLDKKISELEKTE